MKPGRIVSTLAGAALLCALGAVSGCSKPQPPDKERPVDPQAAQMREATREPLDQAKTVEATVEQGAQQGRGAIEAAGASRRRVALTPNPLPQAGEGAVAQAFGRVKAAVAGFSPGGGNGGRRRLRDGPMRFGLMRPGLVRLALNRLALMRLL